MTKHEESTLNWPPTCPKDGVPLTLQGDGGFVAPYIHVNGNLHIRSNVGTVGSIPATVFTLTFSQPVNLSIGTTHFGDGNVREQLTFNSQGAGSMVGAIGAGGTVTGNNTSLLHAASADNSGGSPVSAVALGISTLEITLDGADERDIAGITMSIDVQISTVDSEKSSLGTVKALHR